MRTKGFALLPISVMIIALPGCDNVAWGGIDVEFKRPAAAVAADPAPPPEDEEDALAPLEVGPVLYLVERGPGSEATLLPVAELRADGYVALPDPSEIPNLVERFGLDRWEAGTEFVLFHQGVRAGTLVADGSAAPDSATCQVRPRAEGRVELLPEAREARTLLALRKADLPGPVASGDYPGLVDDFQIRSGTLEVARSLIPQVEAPWPPSVLEIRRHHQPFPFDEGTLGIAASFVYGDELSVGPAAPLAYGLFYLARREEGTFRPVVSWYQRVRDSGKAFPRFLEAYDVRGVGQPDVLLEVFGEDDRWLAVLGRRGDAWEILYRDPCGAPPSPEALRTHP